MMWITIPALLMAVVHYLVAVRHYGLLTPDGLFVCTQLLMVFGTAKLVDASSPVDVTYLQLITAAVMVYMVASGVTYLALRTQGGQPRADRPARRAYRVEVLRPTWRIVLPAVVALALVLLYFQAVGYSAFLEGLRGQLAGDPKDMATLRLDSYAGDTYLFPGYANQFKNVIFPGLVVVILTWVFTRSGLRARLAGVALAGVAVFGLLGNGQRGAFFLFLITLAVYVLLVNRRRMSRWALLLPAMGIPFALLATYALGRGTRGSDSQLAAVTGDLYRRFFNDNQLSGLAGFRYTHPLPVQNGADWLQSLLGVLPGNRGSTLANEIFATLYVSTMGTSPPSLWGSVHYNFGTLGVLAFAAALGFGLQMLTFQALRRPSYNTLELLGYAGVTATVGTWAVAGPDALLNLGLVAYLGLWWWGARWNRVRARAAAPVVEARPRSTPVVFSPPDARHGQVPARPVGAAVGASAAGTGR
ncbi:O-antigen polymerase [Micromonospora sp. NPDC051300]|uniref:O-antigen polymerase n=1 Tax=Micromonospora sp. NPDC051300 TaxID=3364286 RepID=UPI0037915E1D